MFLYLSFPVVFFLTNPPTGIFPTFSFQPRSYDWIRLSLLFSFEGRGSSISASPLLCTAISGLHHSSPCYGPGCRFLACPFCLLLTAFKLEYTSLCLAILLSPFPCLHLSSSDYIPVPPRQNGLSHEANAGHWHRFRHYLLWCVLVVLRTRTPS